MFKKEYYELRSEKVKTPVKIAMLADLHNHVYGDHNDVLLGEIQKFSPDFVCIAGDMLIGHSKEPYETAQDVTIALAKAYPLFYGLGNHEARMRRNKENIYGTKYEDYMKPIREQGAKILVNESDEILVNDQRFCIHGYDLPAKYFEKFNRYVFETSQVEKALGECEKQEDTFHILLAHNPIYFRQYAAWGADLTLSGHLHGGIIRLPLIGGVITPQAKLFPRYCAGHYQIDQKHLIVSRGLGTHTIPIRFMNPPELSLITISPASTN